MDDEPWNEEGRARRQAVSSAIRNLRLGDVLSMSDDAVGGVNPWAAEVACASNLALTLLHILVGVAALLTPFLMPWWALKWALGFIPMAMLAFALFGDCPLTLLESSFARPCEAKYGARASLLPNVPLTRDEAKDRSPAFARVFQTNFIRRFAYWAGGARLSASDCRGIMMLVWGVTYIMFLARSGDVERGFQALAGAAAAMRSPTPVPARS